MDDHLTTALSINVDNAFPDLVDATQHHLYGGLRMLVGDDAEDAAQETYLRAYRSLHQYPPARIRKLELRPWLWTIALNVTRNRRRTAARRPVVLVDQLPDIPVHRPEPIDEALIAAIRSLPHAQGAAVVLHYVLGHTYPEVAMILGRPEGTVKSDTSRAIATLRTKGLEA